MVEEKGMKIVGGEWDEDGWRRMGWRRLEEGGMKMVGGDSDEDSWRRMGWIWWRKRGRI
jgi:hypothetical protein